MFGCLCHLYPMKWVTTYYMNIKKLRCCLISQILLINTNYFSMMKISKGFILSNALSMSWTTSRSYFLYFLINLPTTYLFYGHMAIIWPYGYTAIWLYGSECCWYGCLWKEHYKCSNLVKKLNWKDHSVRNESQNAPPAYFPLYIFRISPLK